MAATNRDLAQEITAGTFREDLYHRLAVFPLRLPPLRERAADVVPLAEHLLLRIGRQMRKAGLELDESAKKTLVAYRWPGNVRELNNVLERAAILADGRLLDGSLLGLATTAGRALSAAPDLTGSLKEIELAAVRQALESTGGHRKKAAAKLGIGLRTLYDKIKEYGLA